MIKTFRTHIWWKAVVPQAMGWVYFGWLMGFANNPDKWFQTLWFAVALVSTAAFGYLFNDWCDIDSDQKARKQNLLSSWPQGIQLLFLFLLLVAALGSWYMLQKSIWVNLLYALQLLSLLAYSIKPIRLKERGIYGVLCDAFYGHVNPALITLTFFIDGETKNPVLVLLLCLVAMVAAIKGVRNIILHQIDDRKKDNLAAVNTFVVKHGALFALTFVNNLLKSEMVFLLLMVLCISYILPPFILSFMLFAVITYLKFSGWKLSYLPARQLQFKFLFFLNDYFENYIPVFLSLLLAVQHHELFWIVPLHLVLFPSFVFNFYNDIKTIRQNFDTEHDY